MADVRLKRTPLYGWHVAAGARMVEFGGWEMPVQYPTGPREEHQRVRSAAGLFDTSHMGRLRVGGPGALVFLQRVQSWDASRVPAGGAHYAMLLNEAGGVIDDIFLYRSEPDWLVVVNASNREKDLAHLLAEARGFEVTIRDESAETGMIALQGPAARRILARAAGPDARLVESLLHHRIADCSVAGVRTLVSASGYTGEPGFELFPPAPRLEEVWRALLAHGEADGLAPCGLAARDSLRAEACLPLYGHEITEDIDPVSAGLDRAAVSFAGHEFIGKQALAAIRERGPGRRVAGFQMVEPGVPRAGYAVRAAGRQAGTVTTGLFSPSTGLYLGMALVEASLAAVGTEIRIVIRDAEKAARIVERPFYRSPHWR